MLITKTMAQYPKTESIGSIDKAPGYFSGLGVEVEPNFKYPGPPSRGVVGRVCRRVRADTWDSFGCMLETQLVQQSQSTREMESFHIPRQHTSYSRQKLEDGYRMIYAGAPSFFGLGLDNCHVPTFWLLLHSVEHLKRRREENFYIPLNLNQGVCGLGMQNLCWMVAEAPLPPARHFFVRLGD